MYLGIDIGGTKTLLAAFDNNGEIVKETKFPTPKKYQDFLVQLKTSLSEFNHNFSACCCAIPGQVDRKNGVGIKFGNLDWLNVPIQKDIKDISGLSEVYLENDAKLAGLFEYNIEGSYQKILYIAPGTGIAIAVIENGQINLEVEDLGGAVYMLEEAGQQKSWDNISSGRALKAKYGKRAADIVDPEVWQEYVVGLARGISGLIYKYQPEAVIIGGGVGAHLEKFQGFLEKELSKSQITVTILKAQRPEEAVIYGCYTFLRQKLG